MMEFKDYMNGKYVTWRDNAVGNEAGVAKFSRLIGFKHSTVNEWLSGRNIPSRPSIKKLAQIEMFSDIYSVLELPQSLSPLDKLPPVIKDAILSAWNSAALRMSENGTTIDSPDGRKIFIEEVVKSQEKLNGA